MPIKQFFEPERLSWQGVYYHFNRWSKLNYWKQVWIHLLTQHHPYLDLSSTQLDGSHTLAKNGGEAIGQQARKAAKTTNRLFLSDNQGLMLAMACPQEGNHHDLYEIKALFEHLTQLLMEAGIDLKGIFLNADLGFDCQTLRMVCEQKQIPVTVNRKIIYILMKNFTREGPSSSGRIPGWIALRLCSYTLKPW
jgi:transposase